jgi:hypothetical protein
MNYRSNLGPLTFERMNALVGRKDKTFLGKRLRFFALVHIAVESFRDCGRLPVPFVFPIAAGQYRGDLRHRLVDSLGKFFFFRHPILLAESRRMVLWMPMAG